MLDLSMTQEEYAAQGDYRTIADHCIESDIPWAKLDEEGRMAVGAMAARKASSVLGVKSSELPTVKQTNDAVKKVYSTKLWCEALKEVVAKQVAVALM